MTEMKKMTFVRYSYALMPNLQVAHAELDLNYLLIVINANGNVVVLGKTAFNEWGVVDHSTTIPMDDMLTRWSSVSRDVLLDKINDAARTTDPLLKMMNKHGIDLAKRLGYISE